MLKKYVPMPEKNDATEMLSFGDISLYFSILTAAQLKIHVENKFDSWNFQAKLCRP